MRCANVLTCCHVPRATCSGADVRRAGKHRRAAKHVLYVARQHVNTPHLARQHVSTPHLARRTEHAAPRTSAREHAAPRTLAREHVT